MEKKRYTPAAIAARQRYNKKKYDSIVLRAPKGDKAKFQAAADEQGESLNGYIIQAINLRIRLEN